MRTRTRHFRELIRTSFWLLPGAMSLLGIGLSFVMIAVDKWLDLDFFLLYSGSEEGARSVLSAIAGSVMTVAGVAFSITIVALTMASSQFGPRLIRNFIRDKGNQAVLGTLIATFLYCILILRSVHTTGAGAFVPVLSVAFAVALAVASTIVIVYFIHHVSTSIQADFIIADVYRDLEGTMRVLFPRMREPGADDRREPEEEQVDFEHAVPVTARGDGYIQAIDFQGLIATARSQGLVVKTIKKPGGYVTAGTVIALATRPGGGEVMTERVSDHFFLGLNPTPEQDVEFAINQLVQVAVRALSPSINDPFTAMTCTDRLASALGYMAKRSFPPRLHRDSDGAVRVIAKPVTFTGVTNEAFNQIRQYGRSSVPVLIRLLEALGTVAEQADFSEARDVLGRHVEMVMDAARELPQARDREDAKSRYREVLEILSGAQSGTRPV